ANEKAKWNLPPTLALVHAAFTGSSARQIFAPKPNEVTAIPYLGMPGSALRNRVSALDPKLLLVFFAPALGLCFFLLFVTFMQLTHGVDAPFCWVLPLALFNIGLAMFMFSVLSVRDCILADQFGLDLSQSGAGQGLMYHWTDMESVNIVDRPVRGKHR